MPRLDAVLVEKGIARSRERAKEMIKSGAVTVDGITVKKTAAEVSGDEVISMTDDLSAFSERSHSCPDGTEITVLQSPEQAYFYTYLDESYLCGHINGSLSESEVDAVLDSVCWSSIGK